jgi:hypothetical protein
MKRRILTLTTCAFIRGCGAAGAGARESTGDRSPEDRGMIGARRHDGLRDDGPRRHDG